MTHLQRPTPPAAPASLADRLDAVLPQTQCRQCGFAGCRPYAEAMAAGEADINRCPPGGDAGIRRLARIALREVRPLAPELAAHKPRAVAVIDEDDCIGCTLCIQACPVDAILGAAKLMHTIIRDECTGCELCVAPCPVDCIRMENVAAPLFDLAAEDTLGAVALETADRARERHRFHLFRLERDRAEKAQRLAERAARARASATGPDEERKRALITSSQNSTETPAPIAPATADSAAQQRNAVIQAAMERARRLREEAAATLSPEQRRAALIKAALTLARQKQDGKE
jgi:electron transport complex protein RnfB